ncbi:MAG TPA: hypothetical protein VMM92_09650, partial [Thermoanaerobaculia bacterium]|nr:hypothetical protein [Thermoanaerobaculia bacterium]
MTVEIARFLVEKTLHPVLRERVNEVLAEGGLPREQTLGSVGEMLERLDARLARRLFEEILPGLAILDPACGSGEFLAAAAEALLELYGAVIAKLDPQLRETASTAPAAVRRKIVRDNLYGVDLDPAAI